MAGKPGRGGRKTRLTPELIKSICDKLLLGNYLSTACLTSGVNPTTALNWIRRGEGRDPERPSRPIYVEFGEAVKKATRQAEHALLGTIRKASVGGDVLEETDITTTRTAKDGTTTTDHKRTYKKSGANWFAAAWIMERRYAKRWAKKIKDMVEAAMTEAASRFRIIEVNRGAGAGDPASGAGPGTGTEAELP